MKFKFTIFMIKILFIKIFLNYYSFFCSMINLVIFASGSGSNAENIIKHFHDSPKINVVKVYSNKKDAGVFERCKRLNIPCHWFSKKSLLDPNDLLIDVKKEADFIVLAGFLLQIPSFFIDSYSNKILNIHPALLPKYGGKGMYGMHVHKAVKENKEVETGITIHFVNEFYDDGAIVFQASTKLSVDDTPDDIAKKVHHLEYEHFPRVIEETLTKHG